MKRLIVLIGPQGSGKTHYCRNVLKIREENNIYSSRRKVRFPSSVEETIVRISQDDHGKKGHLDAFIDSIKEGKEVVVIDRINHTRLQRRRYTELARKNGYKIEFVWFDTDRETCLTRLEKRVGHPTISERDNHDRILGVFFREFEKPEYFEYDEMKVIEQRKFASILDLRERISDQKFIVVGDIHGCFNELMQLLQKCNYKPGDFVISVGDLMDRGPLSNSVIQWFMSTPNTFVVEGNHDNKARRHWSGRKVKIAHGLDKTLEQCKDMDVEAIAKWIGTWSHIIRLPDINKKPTYVVHAGVDGRRLIDRQLVETCLYARYFGGAGGFLDESGDIWYSTLDGSYNIISGHMIHENVMPDIGPIDFVFLLDGGAYQGGELRALVVENGKHRIETVKSSCYDISNQKALMESVSRRDELVKEGLIRCDDKGPLRIYTYTDNCIFANAWDEITLNSRGIILNRETGEVVARPFPKFFNLGERPETMEKNVPWNIPFTVHEKMDGWLGILYRYEGEYCISTRGSFDGDGVAVWATEFLRANYKLDWIPDEVTLVFEIISPRTHIIVDYHDETKLVLLAAFNRHTGEEYSWDQVKEWGTLGGFPLPRIFNSDIEGCRNLLNAHSGKELEGFVLKFSNGLRLKIKGTDYIRRAAIVSNLTPLAIWKAMRDNTLTADYRNEVDADYLEMFDKLVHDLESIFKKIYDEVYTEFESVYNPALSRKEFALKAQSMNLKHKSALFALLDNKPANIRKYVLGLMRPTGNELVTI